MSQQHEALSAFLENELAKHQLILDANTLNLIAENIVLKKRPISESEQNRTITTEVDSMGKVTAESFKLWNISQVSLHNLLQFLWKEGGIVLFDDTAKKAIYALGMLLIEFYPKLKITFNEQDAQVIFAIAQLQKKNFTTGELQGKYQELFSKGISVERIEASLEALVQFNVLKRTAAQEYLLKEKIKNLSRK